MNEITQEQIARLAEPFPPGEIKCVVQDRRRIRAPAPTRFWRFVTKTEGENGCWIFNGATLNKYGHKKFCVETGKTMPAHRYSWLLAHGNPGKLCVLHRCDNPPCVNPSHLFLGTLAQNNADMDAKGRRKPHIGERHPLSKLKDGDVITMRQLYYSGAAKIPELARRFGVSYTAALNAVRRETWRHLEEERS